MAAATPTTPAASQLTNANRKPYDGTSRKLVIAFDIGTTFSGASYSILDPGNVPTIQGVNKFPGHDTTSSASKIPTILYYDSKGELMAVGAEAIREGIEIEVAENEWCKAEWFKLHLRSKHNPSNNRVAAEIPPLPPGKTVVQVFGDFLKYLMECTTTYINDTHPNSQELWDSIKGNVSYVLSHPNGWEGLEQSQMRQAAVAAKIIDNTPAGHAKLSFVTEGEASLHFAIEHGVLSEALKPGDGIVVVDAGGGTVDVSAYKQTKTSSGGTVLEEIVAPECFFQGSVFVTLRARMFLQSFLANSDYLSDLDHICKCFDQNTKIRFKNENDPQFIKFGSTKDNDANVSIRFGQLKMTGKDVAQFFEPSIKCITDAVEEQMAKSSCRITHVVLVGGFSASQWLFNRVKDQLKPKGLSVFRAEHHANKAVSDGSVSFSLDHHVKARVTKLAYGKNTSILYNPRDPEHVSRQLKVFRDNDGRRFLPSLFSLLLAKETQVAEEEEFRRSYFNDVDTIEELRNYSTPMMCYRGSLKTPKWIDDEPDKYTTLCSIKADLSNIPRTRCVDSETGSVYYRFHYDVILLFGRTELKAMIAWKEGGAEKRGPASVIYDPKD